MLLLLKMNDDYEYLEIVGVSGVACKPITTEMHSSRHIAQLSYSSKNISCHTSSKLKVKIVFRLIYLLINIKVVIVFELICLNQKQLHHRAHNREASAAVDLFKWYFTYLILQNNFEKRFSFSLRICRMIISIQNQKAFHCLIILSKCCQPLF